MGVMRAIFIIDGPGGGGENRKLTALKVSRLCQYSLLLKVG